MAHLWDDKPGCMVLLDTRARADKDQISGVARARPVAAAQGPVPGKRDLILPLSSPLPLPELPDQLSGTPALSLLSPAVVMVTAPA